MSDGKESQTNPGNHEEQNQESMTQGEDIDRYEAIRRALEHYSHDDQFSTEDLYNVCIRKGYEGTQDSLRRSITGGSVNNPKRVKQPQITRMGARSEPDPNWDLLWQIDRSTFRRFRIGQDPFWPIVKEHGKCAVKEPDGHKQPTGSVSRKRVLSGAKLLRRSSRAGELDKPRGEPIDASEPEIKPRVSRRGDRGTPADTAAILVGVARLLKACPGIISPDLRPNGAVATPFHTQYGTVECLAQDGDGRPVLICAVWTLDDAFVLFALRLLHAVRSFVCAEPAPRGILVVCGPEQVTDVSFAPDFEVYRWQLVLSQLSR